jgi:hypothetical protein
MAIDKKQSKQARHERKMAEQQKAKQEAFFGLEPITQDQIIERLTSVMAGMNIHTQAILETDFPEAVPLMGPDLLQTSKHFSDAGMTEILSQAMAQCQEEREAFGILAILSWVKMNEYPEHLDKRVNSIAEWPTAK